MGLFKMRQVEDCLQLGVNDLVRLRIVRVGVVDSGTLKWRNLAAGGVTASCRYFADCRDPEAAVLGLAYRVRNGQQIMGRINLTTTVPHYGGVRWWFQCPNRDRSGRVCGRRVGKLYLPPGEAYFGCRECHALTYQSRQEHRTGLAGLRPLAEITGQRVEGMRRNFRPAILLLRG